MKKLLLLAAITIIAGCASVPPIDTTYTAKSQESRVQFLILHYTAGNFPVSLKTLTEEGVSSHYLVNDNPPTIYRLVDENRRAYHAGISAWRSNTQLNSSSIGIEIVNLGFREDANGKQWFDYPQAQIDAVIALVKKIVAEHNIKPEHVIGHSDIAPQRKTDPGPRFPWKQLADLGLIQWPDQSRVQLKIPDYERQLPDVEWFQQKLAKHGFEVPRHGDFDEATRNVLSAFQMKYRPSKFDGVPDAETAAMLDVLTTPAISAAAPAVSDAPAATPNPAVPKAVENNMEPK